MAGTRVSPLTSLRLTRGGRFRVRTDVGFEKHTITGRAGRGGTPEAACAQLPHRLGPVHLTDRRLVRQAHSLGLQVHVWTIDEPAEIEHLLDMGVDGIMTDSPETLKAVLMSRGAWHG